MPANSNRIPAPQHDPAALWSMSPEGFNRWRHENDFPRILGFFRARFKGFDDWQSAQGLSDSEIIEFGVGRFIRPEPQVFIYRFKTGVSPATLMVDNDFDLALRPEIESKKRIVPYLTWARGAGILVHPEAPFYNLRIMGWERPCGQKSQRAWFMRDLELLNIGGVKLTSTTLSDRLLDFTALDGVAFEGEAWNNKHLNLIYCSAQDLKVRTSFPFVYGYGSSMFRVDIEGVRLQDWHFEDCDIDGKIVDSTLFRSTVKNGHFRPMLDNVELHECEFHMDTVHSGDIRKAQEFYSLIRRTYTSTGRFAEAGKYFYLEKGFERKMLFNPFYFFPKEFPPKLKYNGTFRDLRNSYRRGQFDRTKTVELGKHLLWYYLSTLRSPKYMLRASRHWAHYVSSWLQCLWWGYGEKPERVILVSMGIILTCAGIYLFFGSNGTRNDPASSLYFSMVTFATLGYGDIIQHGFLRLVSAGEALLGALSMGLFVAGMAQKLRY